MKARKILAWALPALMFAAAGFLALLRNPKWEQAVRHTLATFTDYSTSTAGCGFGCCPYKESGIPTAEVAGGGSAIANNDSFCKLSAYPVNYYTGEKLYSTTDLVSKGYEEMSQRRYWATDPAYADGTMGPGWRLGIPKLVDKGTKVVLVIGSRHARSWTKSGGLFIEDSSYFYRDTLVTSVDGTALHMKDEDGNNLQFYSFTFSLPEMRGRLYTTTNAYFTTALTGTGTVHGYAQPGGVGNYQISLRRQFEQTAGVPDASTENWFDYAYSLIGSTYQVSTVTFSRYISGVKTTARSVAYEYYATTTSNGPAGSLARARVKDAAGATIEVKYYRYNVDAQSQVTIKRIVEGESYERLKAASGGTDSGVDSASDTTVGTYANYQLTFDTGLRATAETVQGVGAISFSAPTDSAHPNGYNNWKRKVTETLPNSDQNIVYTNVHGQVVMSVFKEASTLLEWRTWYERDSRGRVTMQATPAAVSNTALATLETQANLVGVGTYTYLNSTGLIHVTDYGTSTTATSGTPGDVLGYVKARWLKNGKNDATPDKVEQTQYILHTSSAAWPFSHTIYPIANRTRYRNDDGTGGQTTSFAYTWQIPPSSTESNKIERMTTTYPTVTTAQNGSNAATTDLQYFDPMGRPTWFKDADNFIHVTRYDRQKGAVTQVIRDVQTTTTTDEPSGWVTPAGAGLHLTWNYLDIDLLSRATRLQDPDLRDTYTMYNDANWEVKVYPGWTGTTTTGPTQVTRKDKAGSYTESFTTSRAPTVVGSKPTGTETYIGSNLIHSMERSFRDANGRTTKVESFHSFSSITYQVTANLGVLGNNYYRRSLGYDSKGRMDRDVDWTLTIRRKVYDGLGRVVSEWIGTDDTPTSGSWSPANTAGTNLNKTNEYVYDAGAVGNGNVTTSKFMTAAAASLDTVYQYDFRNRRTDSRGPDNIAMKLTFDNLNQTITQETYASADFTYTGAELRGKDETKFDEKGQVYQTIVHNVDPNAPNAGTIGNRLTSNFWANARGARIKVKGPNGEFQKTAYDGAGRTTASYLSYHDAESAYGDADDVALDTVISQLVNTYDGAGNVIQTTSYQRTDDAATTGELATTWAETDSRRTYTASWFDIAGRPTSTVNYGRNGGTALSRPTNPPAPNLSNVVLVTKYDYKSDTGLRYRVTDNKNRVAEFTFNMLGRTTKTVENYANGAYTETEFDTDRTTEQVWDSSGRLYQLMARNPKGSGLGTETQTTTYAYGTDANLVTPAVWRNDILVAEIYPDSTNTYNAGGAAGSKLVGTYDRVEYTYDYASRKLTWKLQDTTTHTYAYDSTGRLFTDAATTLGSGVDGAVLRLEYLYDSLSRPLTVSSYSATSGGTLLNQIGYTYDGWGQESACTQGHEGTATGAPGYTKAFVDGAVSGEAKYVRQSSATYPNARVIYTNYPAAATVGDKLSRPDNLANDASGTTKYAQYTFLGAGSIVKIAHPAVTGGLNLDYGTGVGNPAGWDDVGRIVDQKWQDSAGTPVIKDRYQYGYDNTSSRTFRDNLTATAKDEFYVMDGLDRVTTAKRGDLNAGRTDITGTPAYQEAWTLEGLGNWKALDQTTAGTATLNQTRTHTKANETTTIGKPVGGVGADWADGVVDQNGNMTRVPKPSTPTELWRLTYDAWGRLVKVVNDVGVVTVAEYKYDARHRRTTKLKFLTPTSWDRIDYYYSCEWQVVEERQILNQTSKTVVATLPLNQFVWDLRYIDAAVLRFRNNDLSGDGSLEQTLYYTQDANMNVTGLLDTAGVVVERVQYDAYGKHALFQANWTTSQASTVYNNEILYAGYRLNPESGMYQVRHREYHPGLGRWARRDPAGYRDSKNLNEYVLGRPTGFADPSGLETLTGKGIMEATWNAEKHKLEFAWSIDVTCEGNIPVFTNAKVTDSNFVDFLDSFGFAVVIGVNIKHEAVLKNTDVKLPDCPSNYTGKIGLANMKFVWAQIRTVTFGLGPIGFDVKETVREELADKTITVEYKKCCCKVKSMADE